MTRSRLAPPKASAMLEALRGMGYSVATALADIIDNSVSAGATKVRLDFFWNGDRSAVRVIDDGVGMTEQDLDNAMMLGSKNPLQERQSDDLGRFGMGLKTASFSQCRRLTVVSRSGGVTSIRRWDLDFIAASGDDGWHLLHDAAEGSWELCAPIEMMSDGTLVLWECLDRIVTPGFTEKDFLGLINRVERHLAMVFHRYLEAPNPRLRLFINGDEEFQRVRPWDPFLADHPATIRTPIERIPCPKGAIEVQGFVLPHRDRLSPSQFESAAGPEGWTAQQGFYVYRNRRLLVAGSWLGLGAGRAWTKEEAHKLARLRLDLPNTVDEDWKIDIRKSTARPPVTVRARLAQIAENVRSDARRVFAHRGQYGTAAPVKDLVQAWKVSENARGVRYQIDIEHPSVRAVLEQAGDLAPLVNTMLRVIEESVPVQRIWLDTVERGDVPQAESSDAPPDDMQDLLRDAYSDLVKRTGLMPEIARQQLQRTAPFHKYPSFIKALPDDPDATGT